MEQVFDKLIKINELINRGATEGEKDAAKIAFEKLVKKHNISKEELREVFETDYMFTYSNMAEEFLLNHITAFVKNIWVDEVKTFRYRGEQRKTYIKHLTKLEYIQISAMYEYFRRHMKVEYKKFVKVKVDEVIAMNKQISNKSRKIKVHKERWRAQMMFIGRYLKASNLDRGNPEKERGTFSLDLSTLTASDFHHVEGGKYNEQIMSDSRSLEMK